MKIKRNKFNLSCGNSLSLRMGDLVPIYVEHLVPGDTFDIESFIAARFAPMQAPIMTDIDIKTWGFAVPYRLVWDDYAEFFTGKNKSGDEVSPVFPRATYGADLSLTEANNLRIFHQIGSLADYLDINPLPLTVDSSTGEESDTNYAWDDIVRAFPDCSMLEPRVYQMIYNEWFRDQNIDEPVEFGTDSYLYDFRSSRADSEYKDLMTIRQKRWAKDYFTSALPTPSMADDVFIPIDSNVVLQTNNYQEYQKRSGTPSGTPTFETGLDSQGTSMYDNNGDIVWMNPNGSLRATDNQTTIRELTRAQAVYQYLLDVARGGNVRYKDFIKTLFNVDVPDYRAEIPEYIGGGQQPVIISEVLQTSETNITPQGSMSGRAVSTSLSRQNRHHFTYTAKEHTIIMIIACVMPKASYLKGLPKRHFKFDRFDYYIPQFDHIGDQEIKRKELNHLVTDTGDAYILEETFGYAPRYAEYKSAMSRCHGAMRESLKYWTMARDFDPGEMPSLNSTFLVPQNDLLDRPFYVQSIDRPGYYKPEQIYLEIGHRVDAWRPMSKLSTPIV